VFLKLKSQLEELSRAELDEHAQGVNATEIDAPFTLEGQKPRIMADVREN
jgi:hypothetical protein